MTDIDEKLFPIRVNPEFCIRCQRCQYSCPPKAIFFKDSLRFVDYNKCKGCLKCVEVCEHGAIEVETFFGDKLDNIFIDQDKCKLCKKCVSEDFCYGDHAQIFTIKKDSRGKEYISVNFNLKACQHCLKCVDACPHNAIIPNFLD